jgi:hypothetical protein
MHSSSIDASSQDNTRPGCFIEISPQVSCPIRMLDLEFGVGIYFYRLLQPVERSVHAGTRLISTPASVALDGMTGTNIAGIQSLINSPYSGQHSSGRWGLRCR